MRFTSTLLAASLLGLPIAARAEDTTKADPFRPVQPAWPDGWSGEGPRPTPTEPPPAQAAEDNEVFTFDNETAEPTAAPATDEVAEEPAAPTTEGNVAEQPGPTVAKHAEPPREVDLHTPHMWMAAGGIVFGVSAIAALTAAIAFEEPELAGATFALGGALGIAGLTVGVVMQNDRLEAAGHEVKPALPTGITLKLALTR